MKLLRTTVAVALALAFIPVSEAKATDCEAVVLAPPSAEPTLLTIIDTEIGTEAFERLVTYSNGGHQTLGVEIAEAHEWFGVCEYVGVGIGHGSGGYGHRPNFTLALWRVGVDVALARSVIYRLVGASSNPVVTNGDCSIACDGTINGVTPTTTTTTTTEAPAVASEPVIANEPAPVEVSEPVTTTTTVAPQVESARALVSPATVFVAKTKPAITKKRVTKKPVVKKSIAKKQTTKK